METELSKLAPLAAEVGDDQEPVKLRPFDPVADIERVRSAYAGLSKNSRLNRFWTTLSELDRRFVSELSNDGPESSHLTWIALAPDAVEFPGFGAASLWFSESNPHEAEFTITVADEWQRHGFGALLFSVLWMDARELGIRRITATSRVSNIAIQSWWSKIGGSTKVETNAVFLAFDLEPPRDYLNRIFYSLSPTVQEVEIAEWLQKWLDLTRQS